MVLPAVAPIHPLFGSKKDANSPITRLAGTWAQHAGPQMDAAHNIVCELLWDLVTDSHVAKAQSKKSRTFMAY